MTSRADLIARASVRLAAAGVPDAARDARLLYRWAARLDGATLAAELKAPALPAERARFADAVGRRARRVPLSQIVGTRLFWGRPFHVSADVLDPRPETETLVAAALAERFTRVLDLGTGSGCILLSLLADRPGATGLGTDISAQALAVARRNAVDLGLSECAQFALSDWTRDIAGPFDLIVSNPPYIPAAEIAGLMPEVRDHEPRLALTPGGDGLDAYRRIAAGIAAVAAPGARALFEVGERQGPLVAEILAAAGLAPADARHDIDGRWRVVVAEVPL